MPKERRDVPRCTAEHPGKLHGSLSLGWYLVVRRDARRVIYIVQEEIARADDRVGVVAEK